MALRLFAAPVLDQCPTNPLTRSTVSTQQSSKQADSPSLPPVRTPRGMAASQAPLALPMTDTRTSGSSPSAPIQTPDERRIGGLLPDWNAIFKVRSDLDPPGYREAVEAACAWTIEKEKIAAEERLKKAASRSKRKKSR
jgi:hypothetical protein